MQKKSQQQALLLRLHDDPKCGVAIVDSRRSTFRGACDACDTDALVFPLPGLSIAPVHLPHHLVRLVYRSAGLLLPCRITACPRPCFQASEAVPSSSFLLAVSCVDKRAFGETTLGATTLPGKSLTAVPLKVCVSYLSAVDARVVVVVGIIILPHPNPNLIADDLVRAYWTGFKSHVAGNTSRCFLVAQLCLVDVL